VSRTLKASVRTRVDELAEKIRAAGVRRLAGLLSAARGAKQIAVGASAVEEAAASGAVRLLLVASDARAAVSSHAVSELIAAGRAVALLDKAELGALVGRDEAGVVAIMEAGFAASIKDAAVLSSFAMPRASADRRVAATEAP
jgi:ribosomal protein L7Ae-like RNA K-turn-binding protein